MKNQSFYAIPGALVESFVYALDVLATQSRMQTKYVKSKINQFLSAPDQRRCRMELALEYEDQCIEEEEEQEVSTQFLHKQKIQFFDPQDHLERYCNVLPVCGFNSEKYDKKSIKSYLLPLFVNERWTESKVIKKANLFVSFKFGEVQLVDVINFLAGAMSFDSSFKDYKTSKTKNYFPSDQFDDPEKLNNTQPPSYETLFNKLLNKSALEKDSSDLESLIYSCMPSEEALSKLKLKQPPATGQ